jgi:hypothetical protein
MKHFLHALATPFIVAFGLFLGFIEAWAEDEGEGYPSIFGQE